MLGEHRLFQPRGDPMTARNVQTAIVLQGGGALGAYEYGVLKALYESRPGFRPVAVAGISIGAITAAVLGGAAGDPIHSPDTLWRRHASLAAPVAPLPAAAPPAAVLGGAAGAPIHALDPLWRRKLTVASPVPAPWLPAPIDQALASFGNPGMYQLQAGLFTTPWLLTSIYDTAPLRDTLAELVDPRRLNDDTTRVIVGAINVATGVMEYFHSRQPGGLTFEHVAASGSLPPNFPMTPIGEHRYWDGGLFSNTPLGPAINALEQADGGDRAVERELVVVELFPMRAAPPQTFTDVLQRGVQLQYTSRLTLDGDFFNQMSNVVDLIAQVGNALPADSPIRSDPLFAKPRAHRKIDHRNVVTPSLPPELSNAGDFSHSSIEARIRAGYEDAMAQGVGEVDAPGLRFGVTATDTEPVATTG